MSKTYDFAPVARRQGVLGRLAVLLLVVSALCVVLAYATGGPSEGGCYQGACWPAKERRANLFWLFLAVWPGGAGVLIGVGCWVAGSRG